MTIVDDKNTNVIAIDKMNKALELGEIKHKAKGENDDTDQSPMVDR